MPIDNLSGSLTVTTRNAERDRWLRDYAFHDPSSDTSDGSQPFIEGSTMADGVMPLWHDIKLLADASDPDQIGGALLTALAQADGVFRPVAQGGSGAVKVSASIGGGTIQAGDEIDANGLRFQCTATALYHDGDQVPITGIDTGPATNLAPGTVMTWVTPAPGIAQTAVVATQADGSGLSGGRNAATDEEYRKLWQQAKAARAASGNDSQIQEVAEDPTLGVAVQKCFTYPAILGPCTTSIAFVLKPDTSGSSRIPNPTQIATVLAAVIGKMPADEGIFPATVLAQSIDVTLKITWTPAANGWSDQITWPLYAAAAGQAIVVGAVTDAVTFQLVSANGNYAGLPQPAIGNTLAIYDAPFATFRRKKILSFTGAGPWAIVCDTSNGASDQSYLPIAGQRVCPWSDSLQDLVLPIQNHFQTFGPGEQVASFFSPGQGQRRQPQSPKAYPNVITLKGLGGAIDTVASVFDFDVAEPALPQTTTVGTPGVTSFLLELNRISAFPK